MGDTGRALHAYINEREGGIRTYVFGRSMWEAMRYWEDRPQQTSPPLSTTSSWREETHKVVVSTTMTPPPEPQTELWDHLDLDRLATLERQAPRT